MANRSTHKLLTVPSPAVAGYEDALRDYFATYRINLMTFFCINFATIHGFETGTEANPAVFDLLDVLSVFDPFFSGDGSVNMKSYRQFLKAAGIEEENRYFQQATSSRLQEDILNARLASPFPATRKAVVPDHDHVNQALRSRLRKLATSPEVSVSRFLPAFYSKIAQQQTSGLRQADIAEHLSQLTGRYVSQESISRFLGKTRQVQERFEKRRQRALMTLAMAEDYARSRIPRGTTHIAELPYPT